jgi:L-seryl-tRNA(Ser) seleniumtransferase
MPVDPHPSLRALPAVGELLAAGPLSLLAESHGHDAVRAWIRLDLETLRERISAGELVGRPSREELARQVIDAVVERASHDAAIRLGRVINATGVVLHTSLGRAPLGSRAQRAIIDASAACNLEVDLDTGQRRARGHQLQAIWRRLTRAGDSLIVNNNAAATVLVLDALCRGREVILSRGQLIEIGGSFRLPEIFAQSGAILREVGTTNRTHLADYEQAIGPKTGAILRVHPSNYQVVGFSRTPAIAELAELARRHGLPCLDDIGSGCLVDTTRFGLPAEPTFQESLAAGADVVLGSGDKLLGGPQCGILLGREELISRMRAHPLARALRPDKLTLAALTGTLDSYERDKALAEIPILRLLATSPEELVSRAEAIHAAALQTPVGRNKSIPVTPDACRGGNGEPTKSAARGGSLRVEVARDMSPVGGGALPSAMLPTAVLRLAHSRLTADQLSRALRLGSPRVFGRIQDNEVLLDMRGVVPEDDPQLALAIARISD